MATRWEHDQAWSNRFIPAVKMLLGLLCIEVAPPEEDRLHNTDLMFDVGLQRIAVRMRREALRLAYNRRNEITIRYGRQSGVTTELAKVLQGWGDLFLYAWGEDRSGRITAYTLIHLKELSTYLETHARTHGEYPGQIQHNADGSSSLLALCIDCMPGPVVKQRRTILDADPPNTDRHWRLYHDPLREGGRVVVPAEKR
jgi:hypothetical protein